MRVLMINSVCGIRSTGRICTDIAQNLKSLGNECKIAYGRETVPEKYKDFAVLIGSDTDVKTHALSSRIFDNAGFMSKGVTKKFIEWVKEYDPDVIHLHNIHGYYINIEILFDYLRRCNKRIIWTLHDCWPFTGHCSYFDFAACDKWKTGCYNCPQKKEYPQSLVMDNSKKNYEKKKKIFGSVPNLTIVTPSVWLKNLVKESFLKEYDVEVINNGINLEVFKPQESELRKKYSIEDKKIILGVAAIWDRRKGLDYFTELSKKLDDSYKVVVIGISDEQLKMLPDNVLGITKTNSITELAQWYSLADVFVNPTLEDNYPTTNLEAIACGTPVITFNTGGSVESAGVYGKIVEKSAEELYQAIIDNNFEKKDYDFSIGKMVDSYIKLY